MREYLKKLPKEIRDLIHSARGVGNKNNMPTYLVGGFVRDLILGAKNLDLDIVVEGDGIKFAVEFASLLHAKLITHKRFGTATVILKPKLRVDPSTSLRVNGERSRTIDIASARKEFYPQPASLPEVSPGSLEDDLFRRDFTINAMAIDISNRGFGRFIDFFGGERDLRHKKIRILHNLSFIDDPTRILRAIRFEKRYSFYIDSQTLGCLKEAVSLSMLEKVEPQRIRDELIPILKEKDPLKPIRRIQKLAGFNFIKPNLKITGKTYALLGSIGKQASWFRQKFIRHRQLDNWLMYFMGMMEPVYPKAVKAICDKFVFRKGEEKRILTYKRFNRKIIRQLSRPKITPARIFNLLEPLSYEAILLLKAKSRNRSLQKHIRDFLEIYNGMQPYISGDDLRRLGIEPGSHYQKIFARVLKAKLNGLVETKEEELALIKTMGLKV